MGLTFQIAVRSSVGYPTRCLHPALGLLQGHAIGRVGEDDVRLDRGGPEYVFPKGLCRAPTLPGGV